MKLYSYYRSSAAYRVRIALSLKGLDYEYSPVNLLDRVQKSTGYLTQNPQGLVPALELDDGTVLQQSMAILEYLEDCHPTPALLPSAPLERAWARSLALHIACDIHPLNNSSVLTYLRQDLGVDEAGISIWYTRWVQRGFAALESQLCGSTSEYCHGNQPGLVDVMLLPQMYNARRFQVPTDNYPTLQRICAALEALPAFARAHPDSAPDAPQAGP